MPIPDSAPPLTLTAYAARRGVSCMAVSRAVKAGRLAASVGRNERGQPTIIDPDLADREWAANTDLTKAPAYVKQAAADRARGALPPALVDLAQCAAGAFVSAPPEAEIDDPPEHGAPPDMATAAARAKHWDAQLKELKFREAAAELVPAADVKRQWAEDLSNVRSRLLSIPTYVKQAAPHLAVADVAVIDRLIRDALEELTA